MPGRGRLVERSFVLTLLTLVLLAPPIIAIFNVPVLILGVPLLHLYCFAVWLVAIVAGARLAAALRRDEARAARLGEGAPPEAGPGEG
jgi:hypothetical protein